MRAPLAGRLTVGIHGNVAVDHQYAVGLGKRRMLALLIPLAPQIEHVIGGKIHIVRHRFEHAYGQPPAQSNQLFDGRRIPSGVGCDHQWPARRQQVCDEGVNTGRRHGAGCNRRPRGGIGGRGRNLFLQHLAGGHQVDGALRIAVRNLQGAADDLLDVAPAANLIVILDVAAHDSALVEDILQPVNKLVAAPRQLSLLGEGHGSGENQHRNTAARSVVQRARQGLRSHVDMHQHRLPAPGRLRVTVGRAQGHHLVRAGDHRRNRASVGAGFGNALQNRRVIAAEIRK